MSLVRFRPDHDPAFYFVCRFAFSGRIVYLGLCLARRNGHPGEHRARRSHGAGQQANLRPGFTGDERRPLEVELNRRAPQMAEGMVIAGQFERYFGFAYHGPLTLPP